MKLFRKLAAAALAGVMALSMLTGCALGDAAKENAMLKALQTIGNSYQVKVSESDSLSKKASGIFAKFKEAGEEAWDVENLPDDFSPTGKKVTYNDVEYMIVVLKMPKNAKDSTKWGYPANLIYSGLWDCVEWDDEDETSGKLKVGFDVMNDAKLTDTQEKAEDYMVVFAKCLDSGTGSGSHA
mgnify:CR=1 FL=1